MVTFQIIHGPKEYCDAKYGPFPNEEILEQELSQLGWFKQRDTELWVAYVGPRTNRKKASLHGTIISATGTSETKGVKIPRAVDLQCL